MRIQRPALRDFSLLIALAGVWVFFGVRHPSFLTSGNISELAVEWSVTAVLALGMLLVMLCGQIDLSIGSGLALCGGAAAVLVRGRWPSGAAMAATMVGAAAVWVAMGALIVRQKIPAFIITLAGMMVFRGVHLLVIANQSVPVSPGGSENLYSSLNTWHLPGAAGYAAAGLVVGAMGCAAAVGRRRRAAFGFEVDAGWAAAARVAVPGAVMVGFVWVCNGYHGVPLSAVILGVVAAVTWVVTRHTRFGRYLYAIGGNEEAAAVSGVPVGAVVVGAFGFMGLIVALGGFMQTAYTGYSSTTTGQLQELDAIAACVIGGTSLKGGRGTVQGVLLGSLIMASLLKGMTLMSVEPEIQMIVRGSVLAGAVWLDVRMGRNS